MYLSISLSKKWLYTPILALLSLAVANAQPYAYVANVSGNNLSVVNTVTNTVSSNIPIPGSPTGIAVSPDGSRVYVVAKALNSVSFVSTSTNSVIGSVTVGAAPLYLAVTPDGSQLYVVNSTSNTVSVVDTSSKTVIGTIAVGSKPNAVAFNADGSRAYVTNLYGSTVSAINTATRTVVGTYPAQTGPSGVTVANGRIYVGNEYSNSVSVYDASGSLVTTITGFNFPNWLAANPSGSKIYVTNGNGASVSVIDTASNTLVGTMPVGNNPTSVAFTTDGSKAFVTNETALSLTQMDAGNNSVMSTLKSVGVYPISVAMQPAQTGPPPCTFTLSQSSASFSAAGGTGSVNVTPSATCGAWTAASNVGWATITSGASGNGAGTVNYSVTPNLSSVGLSGSLTIAGQTFTLTEAGVPCNYSLSATSASFPASGGTGSVNVIAPAGCAWSASSALGWVSITSGASGNGSGTVSFSVNANSSSLQANGSLSIAGQSFLISEAGVPCSYSLSAPSASFPATGGNGSVNVIAPAGCAWTASESLGWVNITSGASGAGNGTVAYAVTANTGSASLSGTLTVAGVTYTVNEAGVACTYSLSAPSASFTAAGGSGSVNVIAPSGCTWTASGSLSWVSITSGASGSGNGTVSYTVNPNTGSGALSGALTVAGQTYTVNEAGVPCTFSLSANSEAFTYSGGSGSVNVIAPSGCAWTATSPAGWVTITSGASGTGNGTVNYSVAANAGSTTLNTTLTLAGQSYTVSETGVACTYSLSANSANFTSAGGNGSVSVIAPSGCTWTASSNNGWATVVTGSTGSGNGTVTFLVNPNLSTSALSGSLTVAGVTFTISEAALSCTYSLSSNGTSMNANSGAGSVNVIAPTGCSWTASSDSPWLTITAGFSGNGNGTVSYSASANPGTTSRTGSLTIGGPTFTVTQAGETFTAIRVNCGGAQFTDPSGNIWISDNAAKASVTDATIANTTTQALYQSDAWSKTALTYQYTVPNGSFTVNLKFAETYMTERGQRSFNIVVNGVTYYSGFDILATGSPDTAQDVSIPVVVSDGQITIQLVPVVGPAKINAIEIL